ncbi:glycosyltransferase family 87 protein [Longitalea luteola]|uniref:glycosyltransferase family 87 protein n=1 Tax=Longitalea luteola TaxID=2812563 RepID=UPI001A97761E|nr:glycosyltransferase family 87 protein [Longitalea luteola]
MIIIKPSTPYYPVFFLAALLGYFIYKAADAPFGDFAGYYFGSRELLKGNYTTVYETWALNALIAREGYTGIFVSYTPFPPFTSIVLAPFLLLPVGMARIVFNIVSAALFVFAAARTIKYLAVPVWISWLIPVLFFIPLRNNIFFGQAYLLLTALLLEGCMAYKKGKMVGAAFLWAGAICFKLFPLVILLFLLAKKQYRQLLYCIAACLLLALVTLSINGWAPWQYYVFTILPRANSGELNDSYTWLFQSAFMLLKNLLVFDPVQNPHAVINSTPLFIVCMALFKALILACCIGITVQRKVTDVAAFAAWITGSLLLSPNGSTYSLILLLIPLLALANSKRVYLYTGMVLVFFICVIPVQALRGWPVLLQFPRLYLMLLLFGVLMLEARMRFPIKPFFIVAALLLLADAGKMIGRPDNSHYLLTEELPLVYDYTIANNKLMYYYRDDKGKHETFTNYIVNSYSTQQVHIQNNQVYFGNKQLTATPDRKRQAMLVNGRDIIYLSDKNRGFGFYTLRRLTVVE